MAAAEADRIAGQVCFMSSAKSVHEHTFFCDKIGVKDCVDRAGCGTHTKRSKSDVRPYSTQREAVLHVRGKELHFVW